MKFTINLITVLVVISFTASCSKNTSPPNAIPLDNLTQGVKLDNEAEISIAQYTKEIETYRLAMMNIHEGLSYSESGIDNIPIYDQDTGAFHDCRAENQTTYTVVKKESREIFYLYSKSSKRNISTDPYCENVFEENREWVEKKSTDVIGQTIFIDPNQFPPGPWEMKIYRGTRNREMRYRFVIQGEVPNRSDGTDFIVYNQIQMVYNPSQPMPRVLEFYEQRSTIKDDPSKVSYNMSTIELHTDINPNSIDWQDLPVDDDTQI